MANISFRALVKEDVPWVELLEQQCFPDAWNQSMLQSELNNALTTYLVMEKDGAPIGYAGYWLVAGEAQITRVGVLKEERGQGYGNLLTAELLRQAWAQEATGVTLEVRAGNEAALAVYEKNGFQSAGIRPGYYEDNHEDAVIMWIYRGQ